jgi:sec-independent protein translocase protein TatA
MRAAWHDRQGLVEKLLKNPLVRRPAAYVGSVDVGAPELIILLVVLVLLFGAKKLPELARGSGRALRIFKEEINARDDVPEDAPETEQPPGVAPR